MRSEPPASSGPSGDDGNLGASNHAPAPGGDRAPAQQVPLISPLSWVPAVQAGPPPDGQAWFRARQEAMLGAELMSRGQYATALNRFHEAVWLAPSDPSFHYQLAGAAEKVGQTELLVRELRECVRIDPCFAAGHDALGVYYRRLGQFDAALRHSATAVALGPRDSKFVANHATGLMMTGRTQDAWDMIEGLVAAGRDVPIDRWLAHLYARLAPAIGHEEQALAVVERALEDPNLSSFPEGRPLLHFAAAGLLDRLGRHAAAFEQARVANETVRSVKRPHNPAEQSQEVSRKVNYFTAERLRSLPRARHGSRRPVFIVGMPRSGTSLVEQILACHPAVFGAGELNTLREVGATAAAPEWSEGEPYPECFDLLSTRRADQLASRYLSAIGAMDATAQYVTDKMPSNFLFLELAELLFPGCHVIHCVRSPLDTCLSCYMTNFANANEFSLDLSHVGAYYRDYRRLMEHWKKVLTVPILEVRYEDLVLDTEGQVRRMLEFLKLPWEDQCLRYYDNNRVVRTASEDQVRRPIYTSSVGRWKYYEAHLGPLIAALGRFTGGGTGAAGSSGDRPAMGGAAAGRSAGTAAVG